MGHKRKKETEKDREGSGREKRAKTNAGQLQKPAEQSNPHRRPRIRKLVPPRPFPTVAPASSATGPRSAHHEGKNNICITRKTKLAAYLRRCKALLVDDGFKELRLSAMGAAIPHLTLLAVSLPPTLPWAESEVHVDVFTGSVEVHDELLSESGSEAEDGPQEEFRTRIKSTMNIIIRIGEDNASSTAQHSVSGPPLLVGKKVERRNDGGREDIQGNGISEQVVLRELDQDSMESP